MKTKNFTAAVCSRN